MFCSHCGVKADASLENCPNCGEKLHAVPAQKKFPGWLKMIIGTALVGLVLALGLMAFDTKPEETIRGQLTALANNQMTEAYYGYTSIPFQEATSLDKFKDVIKTFPQLAQVEKMDILEEQQDGDLTKINVALTPTGGEPFYLEYQLVKVEGKWKIVYFQGMERVSDEIKDKTEAIVPKVDQESLNVDPASLNKVVPK